MTEIKKEEKRRRKVAQFPGRDCRKKTKLQVSTRASLTCFQAGTERLSLDIGHAKSIALNFTLATEIRRKDQFRLDDTNPGHGRD